MKSSVYIHKSKVTNYLLKITLCLLIPFLLFGIYKSGYRVYYNGYGNIFTIIKPILYTLIAILISFIFSKINKTKLISHNLLCNILISLVIIPEANFFLVIGLLIAVNILTHYLKMNPIALYMVLLIAICYFLKDYTFLNVFESNIHHEYVLMDYLLGLGYGGISNTFLIMSLISFLLFISSKEYKKEIPLISFTVYYILLLIKLIFTHDITSTFFINNNLIFAFIFIAPLSIYSPYTKGASYIYGMLLGILVFALSFINLDFGVYLSILILSIISPKLDKFIVRTEK